MCILGVKYLWVFSEGAPFSHVWWKREEAVNCDLPDLQVRGRKHLQNPQAAAAERHNSDMPLQPKTGIKEAPFFNVGDLWLQGCLHTESAVILARQRKSSLKRSWRL